MCVHSYFVIQFTWGGRWGGGGLQKMRYLVFNMYVCAQVWELGGGRGDLGIVY